MSAIITVPECKAYLRIAYDDDDALIESLIAAAQEWATDYCGHSLETDPDDPASAAPPEKFKLAVKFLAAHFYENREVVSMGNTIPREVPFTVTALLSQTRRIPL
jgi:uncharacterized phage protein (predicted DNA packaging)